MCTASGTGCIRNFCGRCGTQAGEPCCPPPPGSPVGASGVCSKPTLACDPVSAFCKTCGGPGNTCCTGDVCAEGGCCFGGSCVGPGQICGTSAAAGTCMGGSCSGCGGPNQPCCGKGNTATCTPGNLCQDGKCTPCGHDREVCCPASPAAPACIAGFGCTPDNTCFRCGGPGDPCCPGNKCGGDGCCFTGRCVVAGAKCNFGGQAFGSCTEGRCNCGSVGEPCCPGAFENGLQQYTCNDPSAICNQPAGSGMVRTCTRCGVLGSYCCSDKTCREKGTACLAMQPEGFRCRKCGGPGEPCCRQPGVAEPFCDGALSRTENPATNACTCE